MAKLYADEDFPLAAVLILRGLGHDVLTVQEAGRCGAADPEVLADAGSIKIRLDWPSAFTMRLPPRPVSSISSSASFGPTKRPNLE